MTCVQQTDLPGITVDPDTCAVSISTADYSPGTYAIVIAEFDDDSGVLLEERTIQFEVQDPGANDINIYSFAAIDQCGSSGLACIVDEDGVPYAQGESTDGVSCMVIPRNVGRKAVPHVGTPPPSCCTEAQHIGSVAYDPVELCATHICGGPDVGWLPLCKCETADPDQIDICYDLSEAQFPLCFGGSVGQWVTPDGDIFGSVDCGTSQTAATAVPVSSEFSCDFSESGCGAMVSSPTFLNWNDAGQVIETVSGNPADGWPCTRPTIRHTMGGAGADLEIQGGQVTITFDTPDRGNCLNLAIYDNAAGAWLEVATISQGGGYVAGNNNVYTMFGPDLTSSSHQVTFSLPALGASLQDLQVILTGTGNFPEGGNDDEETVNNIMLTAPTGSDSGSCCVCVDNVDELVLWLEQRGVASIGWTVQNEIMCGRVDDLSGWGSMQFCDGVVISPNEVAVPVGDAPTITVDPMGDCLDNGELTQFCAECENGTLTWRYRAAGSNDTWTEVTQ